MAERGSLSRPHGDCSLGFSAQHLCVTKPSFQIWAPGVSPGNLEVFVGFPFPSSKEGRAALWGTLRDRQAAPPPWAERPAYLLVLYPNLRFLDRLHKKTYEELWPTPESTHDPGSPLRAVRL